MKKIFFAFTIGVFTLAGCSFKTESTQQERASIQGKIEEVDADWNRYTNRELGFSMEYPKVDFLSESNMEIIEDGNAVYISNGQKQEEMEQLIKRIKDISDFSDIERAKYSILIQEINNDEQLDDFIKEQYGEKCGLGEKEGSDKEGIFNVNIYGPTSMDDPENCLIKYFTKIKYSPQKGKVAAWSMGPLYFHHAYGLDDQMVNSIEFL